MQMILDHQQTFLNCYFCGSNNITASMIKNVLHHFLVSFFFFFPRRTIRHYSICLYPNQLSWWDVKTEEKKRISYWISVFCPDSWLQNDEEKGSCFLNGLSIRQIVWSVLYLSSVLFCSVLFYSALVCSVRV